jgi:hypothetical protein
VPIEAVGCETEPAWRDAEGREPKKRLELAGLRGDVAFVQSQQGLSGRRACKVLGVERSSYRYEPRPDRNAERRESPVQLERQKQRYGYRRLHALLERRGYPTDDSARAYIRDPAIERWLVMSTTKWEF